MTTSVAFSTRRSNNCYKDCSSTKKMCTVKNRYKSMSSVNPTNNSHTIISINTTNNSNRIISTNTTNNSYTITGISTENSCINNSKNSCGIVYNNS